MVRTISRRHFLRWLGLASVALPWLGMLVGSFRFLVPNAADAPSAVFKIGRPEDFPPGTKKFLPEYRLSITSESEGLFAMSAVCTHLGCVVNTVEWGYQCPCHGSKFNTEGLVLRGPANKPLPWFRVYSGPDGQLVVDTRQVVRRGKRFRPTTV